MPDLLSELFKTKELWVGILGALIGGFLTLHAQKKQIEHSISQINQAKRDADLSKIKSIISKIIVINSNLYMIYNNINSQLRSERLKSSDKSQTWRWVRPPFPIPAAINLTTDELVPLINRDAIKLFNKLVNLNQIQNYYISLVSNYTAMRNEINSGLGVVGTTNINGEVVVTTSTEGPIYIRLIPKMEEANMMLEAIMSTILSDFSETKIILNELLRIVRDDYKENISFTMKS